MISAKRIALPPGTSLRRPPHAMLGYASLEDTFYLDGTWYTVSDWRSWRHNEAVDAYRHAGVEMTGLSVGQVLAFTAPSGALLGYARVASIRMTYASRLTKMEVAALDYNEDEYLEFLNFENEAGWYVALEPVDGGG